MSRSGRRLAVMALLLGTAACSSTPEPPADAPAPQPAVRQQGGYKIGKPYQIKGRWYYPAVDYKYAEVGTASWYGADFDGLPTANGEIYDMDDMTAAHRTLPLPSIVQVTNVQNGRSLKLRVNDRGPFFNDRIIDVSRRAAQVLGFYGQGTATVRVEIIADESVALADRMTGGQASAMAASAGGPTLGVTPAGGPTLGVTSAGGSASEPVTAAALAPVAPRSTASPRPAAVSTMVAPAMASTFVQAGAFSDLGNADRARARLTALGAPVAVAPFSVNGQNLYRVRIGPIDGGQDVDRVLASTIEAGFPASRVVVD